LVGKDVLKVGGFRTEPTKAREGLDGGGGRPRITDEPPVTRRFPCRHLRTTVTRTQNKRSSLEPLLRRLRRPTTSLGHQRQPSQQIRRWCPGDCLCLCVAHHFLVQRKVCFQNCGLTNAPNSSHFSPKNFLCIAFPLSQFFCLKGLERKRSLRYLSFLKSLFLPSK